MSTSCGQDSFLEVTLGKEKMRGLGWRLQGEDNLGSGKYSIKSGIKTGGDWDQSRRGVWEQKPPWDRGIGNGRKGEI